MKPSKYNRSIKAGENKYIIFNSLTCETGIVDGGVYDEIECLFDGSGRVNKKINKSLESELIEKRFIIPGDFDELKYLEVVFKKTCLDSSILEIIILPTIVCNFNCTYCFVEREDVSMTKRIVDATIDFIKNRILNSEGKIKSVGVQWFGGEPLLRMNTMKKISEELILFCDKNSIEYNALVVTNGSLLNEKTENELNEMRIRSAKITIDGTKEIHDSRRPFRNKKSSSYEKIIENLQKLQNKIEVIIQINVDKRNIGVVKELLEDLKKKNLLLKSKKIRVTFGFVHKNKTTCDSKNLFDFTKPGDIDLEVNAIREASKFGRKHIPHPRVSGNSCLATAMNAFVIDPLGYIYKCYINPKKENAVGNVLNSEDIMFNTNYIKHLSYSPFTQQKCKECDVLPLCFGGCVYEWLEKSECSEQICSFWKYGIDKILLHRQEVLEG